MTTPASPNSISLSQVNTENRLTATALVTMNDTLVRTLAGVGGSGTIITMDNLRNKTFNGYITPLTCNGNTYTATFDNIAGGTIITRTDGTWAITSTNSNTGPTTGNWWTPTTTSIGTGKYVRFTRVSFTGGGTTATTGWLQLNGNRSVGLTVSATTVNVSGNVVYKLDFSSDSLGTTISSTGTVTLVANANYVPGGA